MKKEIDVKNELKKIREKVFITVSEKRLTVVKINKLNDSEISFLKENKEECMYYINQELAESKKSCDVAKKNFKSFNAGIRHNVDNNNMGA